MNNQTVKLMQSCILFQTFVYFVLFQINSSAPINSSVSYDKFLDDIKHDNCSFPGNVILPFSSADTFDYLGTPLKVCKAPETTKRSKEAVNICKEIFNILKNITCRSTPNVQLPEIKVEFSQDVCTDIGFLQFSPSVDNLLKHINDKFICEMMCDGEFQPACQVLLWSYEVQQQMESIPKVQKDKPQEPEKVPAVHGELPPENNEKTQNEDGKIASVKETPVKEPHPGKTADTEIKNPLTNVVNTGDRTQNTASNVTTRKENTDLSPEKKDNKDDKSETKVTSAKSNAEENQQQNELDTEVKDSNKVPEVTKATKDGVTEYSMENENAVELKDLSSNNNKAVTEEQNKKNDVVNQNKPFATAAEKMTVKPSKIAVKADVGDTPVQNNNLLETTIAQKDIPEVKKQDVHKAQITNKESNDEFNPMPNESEKKTVSETTVNPKLSSPIENGQKTAAKPEFTQGNDISESIIPEPVDNRDEILPITTKADLEKMEDGNEIPESVDKDQDPYNDMESEGEYSKVDYDDDDGFSESSKSKKTEQNNADKIPDPVINAQNDLPKYDVFPPRNSISRGPDDIQVIPSFPEQEDSHFFFYFLSIVLILMAGYLIFHNKQKIIALIVEGRHERRRRSHGVGYKKLETK